MQIARPALETQIEKEERQMCDHSDTLDCAGRTVSKLSEWNIETDKLLIDTEEENCSTRRNLSQYHPIHYKFHMDCPEIDPRPPLWGSVNKSPEAWQSLALEMRSVSWN